MIERLITVGIYSDSIKAHLESNRLEAAGIPTYLEGEDTASAFIGIGAGFVQIKLNVAEHDAERARELLASPPRDEPDTGIQTEPDEPVPSEDLDSSDALIERAWRAALFGLFTLPLLLHIYSLVVIGVVAGRDEELSETTTRKMYWALGIDGIVLVGGAVICSGSLGTRVW